MNISGKTKVYTILGNPVAHCLSPALHNASFKALKMDSVFIASPVKSGNLEAAVKGLRSLGFQGGTVTAPYKELIIPYLDNITEEGRLIGAINTLYWNKGELWGTNTDGAGFVKALQQNLKPNTLQSKSILIVGAGGAARAITVSLASAGVKNLNIVNIDKNQALSISKPLQTLGCKAHVFDWEKNDIKTALSQSELVINTTSLGMEPNIYDMPPLDVNDFRSWHFFIDVIYQPKETLLLRKAKECGCKTMNGLNMLFEQGILAFNIWTGTQAPVDIMRRTLDEWFDYL